MANNQYTKNIDVNVDNLIVGLKKQYLQHFTIPPLPSSSVQKIDNYGYGLVAKNIKWDYSYLTNRLGITISTSRVFITNPHSFLPIHKDCIGNEKQTREWAINIPLFNCNKGYNVWYDDNDKYKNYQRYSYPAAIVLEHPSPIESYRERLDTIKLIRTDVFHGVDNTINPNYRVVLSLRSNDNVSWKRICEIVDETF